MRHGVVELIPVQLGVHDDLAGRVELLGPLAAGDTLLLGSAQGLAAGSAVRVLGADTGASGR